MPTREEQAEFITEWKHKSYSDKGRHTVFWYAHAWYFERGHLLAITHRDDIEVHDA